MIYFYDIKIKYYINKNYVIKDYLVSFADLIDFLYMKRKHNSSLVIMSIMPHYSRRYIND